MCLHMCFATLRCTVTDHTVSTFLVIFTNPKKKKSWSWIQKKVVLEMRTEFPERKMKNFIVY